jgi:MFS family permease
MLTVLANRTYRHLFLAQVVALVGTGLATVALGLLAFDLAGGNAGQILGTALAIKMAAYIGVAPIAAAFANRWPRRNLLVTLDLIRAAVALALPFVTQVWQIYILIFFLQSASAAFTPTFQATIPDVLPKEEDYTNALSLSRLAYDLESVASPMLAAVLLTFINFHGVFIGTTIGFLASAALVVSVLLPKAPATPERKVLDRTTRGIRIYLSTPRLRGLLALNLVAACGSAMVIINTVVLVQGTFGLTQRATALAFVCFGGGSMLAAITLPKILKNVPDRSAMLFGASILSVCLFLGVFMESYSALLPLWCAFGIGYSLLQTPSGRLLRRSSHIEDRPALFAAQFALSHACWLITYPLAGWLGAAMGLQWTFAGLGILAAVAIMISVMVWPKNDPDSIPHQHEELPNEDTHGSEVNQSGKHEHVFMIDDLHSQWPKH